MAVILHTMYIALQVVVEYFLSSRAVCSCITMIDVYNIKPTKKRKKRVSSRQHYSVNPDRKAAAIYIGNTILLIVRKSKHALGAQVQSMNDNCGEWV